MHNALFILQNCMSMVILLFKEMKIIPFDSLIKTKQKQKIPSFLLIIIIILFL